MTEPFTTEFLREYLDEQFTNGGLLFDEWFLSTLDLEHQDGYDEGYQDGYDEGYQDGYDAGYFEGYASAADQDNPYLL
jgi:hypothetical protein